MVDHVLQAIVCLDDRARPRVREHAFDRQLFSGVHEECDGAASALGPRLDKVVVNIVHGDLVLALDLGELLPRVCSHTRAHKEDDTELHETMWF